ncbi:MAG: PrsW family intramembrane metalloprotease [Polyangiaceae bacterium]
MARLVLLIFCVALLGCSSLAGVNDVELDYEAKEHVTPAKISSRLGTAQISADVDALPGERMRVTVDADAADLVDDLLHWRGGIAAYRVDPGFVLAPGDAAGLTPKTETGDDGAAEHYFVGAPAAVARAIKEATVPPGHRVFAEYIDQASSRTRAVFDPPVREWLAPRSVEAVEGGHSLSLELPESAVDIPLAKMRIALVRGRSVLDVQTIAGDVPNPLVVHFGTDLYSYTRAHRVKTLLRSPVLPILERVDLRAAPPRWPVAIASVILPFVLSCGWLFFVRRFDRAHPEPMWLVLATFFLGGLSVIPAGLAEYACMSATPYLNPTIMTLGGQLMSFPIALLVFSVVVGLSEEGAKFLGAWSLAGHHREFDEPVDGIVYGVASALGFAAVENVKYFAVGRLTATIIAARTFTSVPAHMFFGAIWGYALGQKLIKKRTSVLLFLGYAALAHGAFDTFLSIEGLSGLALLLNVGLASLFIILLRRALRHGVVVPGSEAVASSKRQFFTLGSRGTFALWAVAFHAFAFGTFVLGAYFEIAHRRVGYGFLGFGTVLLALLGLAANGLSSTIPLDAAIDENGVTFGGTTRTWASIRGITRGPNGIRIDSTEGDLFIGLGSPSTIGLIAEALEYRLRERDAS